MKLNKLVLPALAGLACFSANTAHAQPAPPLLQFTEISDTELTVTLDGSAFGTVQNLGQDHWQWHSTGGTSTDFTGGFLTLQWQEPEDSNSANTVDFGLFSGQELGADIRSEDGLLPGASGALSDGQRAGPLSVTPLPDGTLVTFVDLGDQGTSVPDSGSTSVLLFGASIALLGLSRARVSAAA